MLAMVIVSQELNSSRLRESDWVFTEDCSVEEMGAVVWWPEIHSIGARRAIPLVGLVMSCTYVSWAESNLYFL